MIIIINIRINNKPEEHKLQHEVNKPNGPIIILLAQWVYNLFGL